MARNLWAVDIETGGLEIGSPVIEVAFGPVFHGDLTVLWNRSILPHQCDVSALAINHCFDDDRPHAPEEVPLYEPAFANVIAAGLKDAVLVASNPQFDSGHLEALLQKYGMDRTWSYRLIDLKSLVVGWVAGRGVLGDMPERGWSQKDAAVLVGAPDIPSELQHTAAGDAEQLRQIVRMVLGGD